MAEKISRETARGSATLTGSDMVDVLYGLEVKDWRNEEVGAELWVIQ